MANILVVDDSMMERKVLGDILTALGHTVIGQAKNGEQALEEYLKLKPDLVTMDLTMCVAGGAEATSKIIAEDPEARIVVVSSHQEKRLFWMRWSEVPGTLLSSRCPKRQWLQL